MKKAIIVYVPVIHPGYIELFDRHTDAEIVLLSAATIKQIDETIADQLSRDIRCLPIGIIQKTLETVFSRKAVPFSRMEQLKKYDEIIMPYEDISKLIGKEATRWATVMYDHVFLRWDWTKTMAYTDVVGEYPVTTEEFDRFVMGMARGQAGNSSDFWRQVGAVVPKKDSKSMLCAGYNEHMPTPMSPYVDGDPRLHMKPGERPDICTAIHAEASVISQAARQGIPLEGCSIYVTTFPCSNCARSIAVSGIKKVFFQNGYSQLDAAKIFQSYNIEVFQVK